MAVLTVETYEDPDALARAAAAVLADRIRAAVAERGRCAIALSGGRTPWAMLARLVAPDGLGDGPGDGPGRGATPVPWSDLDVYQVDERVAQDGDASRNLTRLLEILPRVARVHAMPVTEPDLASAARRYAASLPDRLDLVQLGLGDDGHTASLVPGDPVLDVTDRAVAVTGPYRDQRRMTMTYPVLDGAREALWVVSGADKAAVLPRLVARDPGIPAGRVRAARTLVMADAAAARCLVRTDSV